MEFCNAVPAAHAGHENCLGHLSSKTGLDVLNMRAPRFQLNLPIQYRCAGGSEWHQSTTLNISRSGVLFRAPSATARENQLELEVPVEIRVLLSGSPAGMGELTGHGRIVRVETPDDDTAVAAEFSDYRFERSEDEP